MNLLGGQLAAPAAEVDRDLEQVLLALADGSYVLSTPDGAVAESGVGVAGLLGSPAEALVGRPIAELLAAGAGEQSTGAFEQMLRAPSSDPSSRPVFTARCAGATTRSLQLVVVCVPLALGWEFTSLLTELRSRDATWHPEELRLRHGRALEAVEGVVLRGLQPDPDARLAGILIVVRDIDAPPLTRDDVDRRMAEQRSAVRNAAAEEARRRDEAAGRLATGTDEHEAGDQAPGLEDLVERARVLRERVEDAERDAAAATQERDEALARLAEMEAEREAAAALAVNVQDVEGRASQLAGERDEARARLEARGHELQSARSEVEAARNAATSAQAELQAAHADAERLSAELVAIREAVHDERAAHSESAGAELAALRAEADAAHTDAEALRAEVHSARAELNAVRGESALARGEAAAVRAQLQSTHQELHGSREQLDGARAELQARTSELHDRDGELHARTTLLAQRDAQLHNHAAALHERERELEATRAQADAYAAQLTAAGTYYDEARAELDAVRGELHAVRAEVGEKAAELDRARAEVEAKAAELERTQAELEATRAAAADVRAEREQARLRAQQLMDEAQQARAAAEAIRAEFAFDPIDDGGSRAPGSAPVQRTPWSVPASTATAAAAGAAAPAQRDEKRPELPAVGPGEAAALIALNGSFRRLDDAFCSLLGCREEDLRAARWPSIIDRENLRDHQEIARALKAGEIQSAEVETVYMHAQGLLVPIAGTISLHRPQPDDEPYFLFRAEVSRTAGVPGVR